MKRFEVRSERVLNGNTFYIRPFSAFAAANLSGEVTGLILPLIGLVAPVFISANAGALDVDAETAVSALANGASGVNGDKLEALLKKLLVKHRNVSVQLGSERDAQDLTEDLADELFCGEADGLFILALDVIKVNYSGFFKKIGDRFGGAEEEFLAKAKMGLISTAN